MNSILQDKRECWLTRQLYGLECTYALEKHEPFGGSGRRQLCIDLGLRVYLTHDLHNEPPDGVHFNTGHRLMLQQYSQRRAMEYFGWSIAEFAARFGKNYLEDDWDAECNCPYGAPGSRPRAAQDAEWD